MMPSLTEPSFAAATIATSDYLPWVRVLADSFAAHHPGVRFVALLLDEPDPSQLRDDDAFELLTPAQIGIPDTEYGWMRAIYNGFELSCATKPWLLRFLLSEVDAALYLDGDILVCDSLHPIARRAADAELVICPHTLEPLPDDGLVPDEDTLLRLGQFNAGFLAVGSRSLGFLDWWTARLRRQCADAGEDTPLRFVDQRWLDLTVNYFEVDVLRARGANVAYWNVRTREVQRTPDGYRVDGEPLLFMHFSGFEPDNPRVLSKHAGRPAPAEGCEGGPATALETLCEEYAARLCAAGFHGTRAPAPAHALPGGIVLNPAGRAALRAALIEAERSGSVTLPDPGDADAVLTWLRAPVTAGATSWYLWGLRATHERTRSEFAEVPGADEFPYLMWSLNEGVADGLVPPALAGPASPIVLEGARGLIALVATAEVLADPSLLAGIAEQLDAGEVTLVLHAPGYDAGDLVATLEPLLVGAGLDGPNAPNVLGLLLPAAPGALAASVHCVLTRRPVDPALAAHPQASDATALRRLADAFAATRPLAAAG